MVPVARRGLRNLYEQRLHVAQKQMLQRAAALEFSFDDVLHVMRIPPNTGDARIGG